MDIADVAYDYFLSNGMPETTLNSRAGETVRIRIINGSATTYFHVNFAGGPLTIINADGQRVQPVEKNILLIGVAETYDVIVRVPADGSYELRASAHDGSGFTSTWLGEGPKFAANSIPQPDLYKPMHSAGMGSLFALTPAGSIGMPNHMIEKGHFDKPGMGHSVHQAPQGPSDGMSRHDMSETTHHPQIEELEVKEHQMESDPSHGMMHEGVLSALARLTNTSKQLHQQDCR